MTVNDYQQDDHEITRRNTMLGFGAMLSAPALFGIGGDDNDVEYFDMYKMGGSGRELSSLTAIIDSRSEEE